MGIPMNSQEFPENAILEKGIPEEFQSIPDLGNSRFGNSPPLERTPTNERTTNEIPFNRKDV